MTMRQLWRRKSQNLKNSRIWTSQRTRKINEEFKLNDRIFYLMILNLNEWINSESVGIINHLLTGITLL
jgi:hypothetical protein